MSSSPTVILLCSTLLALGTIALFLTYVVVKYSPIVGRIFEEKPMFLPLRVAPSEGGEGRSV